MIYIPYKWVVLEFNNNGEVIRKVFAGWHGGFADGDSWRMNSGITEVIETDDMYIFKGYSGSEYHCLKTSHGMSSYMNSIFTSFERQIAEREVSDGAVSMRIVNKDYNSIYS